MATGSGWRDDARSSIRSIAKDLGDRAVAFLRRETLKVLGLPDTSIEELEAEIRRQAEAADFTDVLPSKQAHAVRVAVEASTLNTIAEDSATDSIRGLIVSSRALLGLCMTGAFMLLMIGFSGPYADARHHRFDTVGVEIIIAALVVKYVSKLRLRLWAIYRPVALFGFIVLLTILRHIQFPAHIISATTTFPAWASGKAPRIEVVNWYHVAHLATGLVQLATFWLLVTATPRALLMFIHTEAGLSESREDEASSLLLLGLVNVAIAFRRERDRGQKMTAEGRPLRELTVAGIRVSQRRWITRYLGRLAKFTRTTWARSIRSHHPGIRRDAAFIGDGISAELSRIQRCVALGEISAEAGYGMFANASSAFVEGRWRDLMIEGYTRRTAFPSRLWKALRQAGALMIASAAVIASLGHIIHIPQPYSGTIATLSFGYIIVKLLMLTDPEFKTNFDITNKVLDNLRPNKAK